jgi:hypothetical protein
MRILAIALTVASYSTAYADPQSALLRNAPQVSPVLTEHTAALQCLGGLIDQSPNAPVTVVVQEIDDTTVPVLNEDRRLSMGGSFVLHTALSRMETPKVQSVLNQGRAGTRTLTLSGAWTQDDLFTDERGFGLRMRAGQIRAGLGRRTAYDFIAGDFASSVNGRVLMSSAVGVALPRRGNEAFLIVDDGDDGAEIGLDKRRVQGPQMAQRRVLEAVALVHLANYFDIDFRPCLQAARTSTAAFSDALQRYEAMSRSQRNDAVKRELSRLGHASAGSSEGVWDQGAVTALSSFQSARRLPVTGRHSPVLFALMATSEASRK